MLLRKEERMGTDVFTHILQNLRFGAVKQGPSFDHLLLCCCRPFCLILPSRRELVLSASKPFREI